MITHPGIITETDSLRHALLTAQSVAREQEKEIAALKLRIKELKELVKRAGDSVKEGEEE